MMHCLVRTIGGRSLILVGLLLFGAGAPQMAAAPATPAPAGVRIGIFNRNGLVLTFYRSAFWNAKLTDLMGQRNKAAAGGDIATIDKIEGEIQTMKELADKQLAGKAPITNIYEQLAPQWADIAREANVQLIVDDPLFLAPNAPVVDITAFIVKRFPTKPRTPSS
jgi:hypothetical protein